MMTYESDIFLNDSSSVFSLNNTYSNTSFGDLFSNVTRQWYVTVNVTNFTYSPLENATVSLNDSSNNLLWTENTTSSGLTSSHIVSQYFLNSSGYLNYTPHDIIVSKNGFIEKIRSEAIDESMSIFFRLGANKTISSCQTMDEEGATYFLNVNITDSSPGDPCMVIEASNVTLDCMNNNITGSSDWGMYVNNADNVTIQYCNIYNFTATGILFENSSFGLIEYNDVSNSTFGHGIQMGTGSHNNSICFNNASHNELTAYIAIENTSYYNVFHDNFSSYCNDMGFEAEHGAHHNYFHNNTILDTEIGVKLSPGSHNNTIRDNFINNTGGVNIDNSSDNLIENNVISYSNSTGVTFQDNSSRNRI
ncbi:MAG: right-handed parallel beta-helix repeat-containing protein, partial [Candidatus Peribacteraceae bacterium]|nr:right-handed parallel beta-helix repeat-containing protein [Candidatus Peribacteraceae bacterium]